MPGRRVPHVVIAGCGFAGLEAARQLSGTSVRLTLIDESAHFVFRPLLSQLLAGEVPLAAVARPFEEVVGTIPGASFLRAELTGVEPRERRVLASVGSIPYDYLLLGTGARPALGPAFVDRGVITLNSVKDWQRLERALAETQALAPRDRDRASFLVVGGGPQGVELAATLGQRLRRAPGPAAAAPAPGVVLVHRGPRLLGEYPEDASEFAAQFLRGLGVEVHLGRTVGAVTARAVRCGDQSIAARQVIWAGGSAAPALDRLLGLDVVAVGPDLAVRGHPEILVVGDLAAHQLGGAMVPGLASAAAQSGLHAARCVWSDLGRTERPSFAYQDQGYGTYLGPGQAIVVMGPKVITGKAAHTAKLLLHRALSTASSLFGAHTPGQAIRAAQRRLEAASQRLASGSSLAELELTPPVPGSPVSTVGFESQVPRQAPAQVFAGVAGAIEQVFGRMEVQVLDRIALPDDRLRLMLRLGGWPSLHTPIELVFDHRRHDLVITTLATHPLRAVALIEVRSDGDGGTLLRQTNRYQKGLAATLAGHLLGLEERVDSFWRRFHQAARSLPVAEADDVRAAPRRPRTTASLPE